LSNLNHPSSHGLCSRILFSVVVISGISAPSDIVENVFHVTIGELMDHVMRFAQSIELVITNMISEPDRKPGRITMRTELMTRPA
jgi:hypothetical protein